MEGLIVLNKRLPYEYHSKDQELHVMFLFFKLSNSKAVVVFIIYS